MNKQSNIVNDQRGIILTDNVNLEWINSLSPRYHKEYVKFVVDMKNNKVVIGMDVYADAEILLNTDPEYLYGGNIYSDGHIVYQSTLNVEKNLKIYANKKKKTGILGLFGRAEKVPDNMRIIIDKETIAYINTVLFAWIEI